MAGYWNKILRVDLTSGKVLVEEVSEDLWKFCFGGAGYGAKVLLDETTADTKPFDEENPLVFATGAYNAGNNPGNSKWSVTTIGPLTNTYCDSAGTAKWGATLKKTGFDAIVVKGKAKKPVYILVDEEKVEIKDAQGLWGMDSYEIVDAIKDKEQKKDLSTVAIGPAGENLVKISCIVADGHSFAGRGGTGAVMGSKNLKAIAVRGKKEVPMSNREAAKKLAKQKFKEIFEEAKENGFRDHGTPSLCIDAEGFGDMPIKNWSQDVWPEGAAKIGAPNYTEVLKAKPHPCTNCPVGCHRKVVVEDGPFAMEGPGPEYETLGMLGTNLLIDDPKAIAKGNDVCNRLGMDTISTGACIGVAMECYENGWISKDDIGIELEWGSPDAMLELMKQIGNKEGFGEIFADGALEAAKKIHPQAVKLVSHTKGMEFPAHDGRANWTLAVTYATGTRGACHMRGVSEDCEMGGLAIPEIGIPDDYTEFFNIENKSDIAVKMQDFGALCNSAVICAFMIDGGGLTYTSMLDMINNVTGWDWTVEDIIKCSQRIFNLQRLVNIRDGHSRKTDTLPYRHNVAAQEGFRAWKVPPLDRMLDEYYKIRKWDENGIPTKELMEELDIEEYAKIAGIY